MRRILTIFSALISLTLFSCTQNSSKKKHKVDTFPVVSPIYINTSYNQEFVADIAAIQHVELRSRIKGYVEKIHVDEGSLVHSGQLLFTIGNPVIQQEMLKATAQLKSALAELKMANIELNNTKILAEKNIVSKSELSMAQAKCDAANAKIEEAQAMVSAARSSHSFTNVRAPFAGNINRIPFKIGSLVDEGTLLTSISNNSKVYAYFNLSEKEYLIKQQEKEKSIDVKLVLADGSVYPYMGKIETAESEINKNTGNIAFRAIFDNPKSIIKHGASAKIQLTNHLSNVLVVPQKSTFDIQENTYVFVVDKNNLVSTRKIEIKQRIPLLYVIKAGLSKNDRIIYEGIQGVKDGDVIKPEYISLEKIIKTLK